MSLEDAVRSGMNAYESLHGDCEAEIARLRERMKELEELERAVWSQGLEKDGETRATLTLENQRLKQRIEVLQTEVERLTAELVIARASLALAHSSVAEQ